MSIAAIVATAIAATAAPAAPAALIVPPIVINVAAIADVSPSVVAMVIDETEAIYRSAGVRFIWRRGERSLATLRVIIDRDAGPARDDSTPLGWLTFENGAPAREIHLSYDNAERFLEASREVVGPIHQKTRAEHDTLVGRALGRALAHELGHYLLATTQHTPRGLLKGSRTAQEFFSPDRSAFGMDVSERRQAAARLLRESDLARRHN